jgi:molecular chaperone GrpE
MNPETDQVSLDPPENPLQAELEKAKKQIADYQSLVADFDNARKRLVQDAERTRKYAHEGLARDILGALDNLDRAVEAAANAGESGGLVVGVKATGSLLQDALKRYGVVRMAVEPGAEFDPNLHQAVSQTASESVKPGAVAQVLQSGYMIHDRVLRPASVIVAADV